MDPDLHFYTKRKLLDYCKEGTREIKAEPWRVSEPLSTFLWNLECIYDMVNLSGSMRHSLKLMSPRLWRGVYLNLVQNLPDGTFSMISSWFLLHLVAPFLLLSLIFCLNSSTISCNCNSSGGFLLASHPSVPQYTASAIAASVSSGTHTTSTLHKSMPCIVKCMERAALATLISPLSVCKTFEAIPHAKLILRRLRFFVAFRVKAANEELSLLKQKVACGDAIRTSGFDVHFPSIDDTEVTNVRGVGGKTRMYRGKHNDKLKSNVQKNKQNAMILIPGAFVDHTSYSTIASRIASEGNIIVVVMSLEPLRIAGEHVLELKDVKQVILSVTKLWKRRCASTCRCDGDGNNNSNVELEWSLAGHSFGGYGAMRLAPAFVDHRRRRQRQQQNGKSANTKRIKIDDKDQGENNMKIVLWGVGNMYNYVTDISNRGDDIDVLVLLGSNDNMCKFETKKDLQLFQSKLPPSNVNGGIKVIKGATHDQFANYPGLAVINGYPDITREKQYDQVIKATLDFLRG